MSKMADLYQSIIETKLNHLALNHEHMGKQEMWAYFMWIAEQSWGGDLELYSKIAKILPKQVFGHAVADVFEVCQRWVEIRDIEKTNLINGFDDLDAAAFTLELSNNCRHGVMQDINRMLAEGATEIEVQKLIDTTAQKILRNPEFFQL